ncbi:MAG: hypothetical protein QOJ35_3718 [Solirubrobacteraceae bacterium]|jgi:hypothetical protein|nr:hypothetical protein [Solirubrobacteraceae bacterium]
MPSLIDVTDHPRRRPLAHLRGLSRGRRGALALAVLAATVAAPASALAADPPTILTAGVNAADNLYATWSVAPGTSFDFVTFSTVPDPDPSLPSFFAPGNFAGFCDSANASTTCTSTSYVAGYPVGRDRRYFVKVSAKVGDTTTYLSSPIWVIDDAKPQIPGSAPDGASPPTNTPVAGHQLAGGTAPPPPPPAAPRAALKLLTPPSTIATLLRKGVRVNVGCTVTCGTFGRLTLGSRTLGSKTLDITGAGTGTLTVKLSAAGRRRLRGRSRARIKLTSAVSPFGGTTVKLTRSFTVHR